MESRVSSSNVLNQTPPISKSTFALFDSDAAWKQRIESECQISKLTMTEFEGYIGAITNAPIDYKLLYSQLQKLEKIAHRLPAYLKYTYRDPQYHLQVLTCCFNNLECAKIILPACEDFLWITLSIYAGFNDLIDLADRLKEAKITAIYFNTALVAANKTFFSRFISSDELEEDESFFFEEEHVDLAAGSGDYKFFLWVLDNIDPEATYEADEDTMIKACLGGNLDIIKFLMDEFHLEIDTLNLSYLMKSGSSKAVNWVLSQMDLILNDGYLVDAAKSGNLALVTDLRRIGLEESSETRRYAAKSGNVELYKYLMQLTNPDIFPLAAEIKRREQKGVDGENGYADLEESILEVYGGMRDDIEFSALSGNRAAVDYCHDELMLPIDHEGVFLGAIRSGNILLTKELKDKFHWQLTNHQKYFNESRNFSMSLWCACYTSVENAISQLMSGVLPKAEIKTDAEQATLMTPLLIAAFVEALLNSETLMLEKNHQARVIEVIQFLLKDRTLGFIEYSQTKQLFINAANTLQEKNPDLANQFEKMAANLVLWKSENKNSLTMS